MSNVPGKKQVLVTGDQFTGATATFDQDQRPAVSVELNEAGGETNISTGWHAIEFLLWGQDLDDDGPGDRPASDRAKQTSKRSTRGKATEPATTKTSRR